jgi:hypothetical protein
MKKLFLSAFILLLKFSLSAQAPEYFNYQAVIRNPDGTPRPGELVSIQLELLNDPLEGSAVYMESHQVRTDVRGLVQLKVGDGTFFNEIDWERGPYFLSISVDGVHMGTSQLLSVPYALYARRAGQVDDDDPDPTNEIQTLSLEDGVLGISGGNQIELPGVNTPWVLNFPDVYYPHNVGIGVEARSPQTSLDIRKNVTADMDRALIRLRNTDEGGKASVSLALEVYKDKVNKTFYRSEFLQTSADFTQIPDFDRMTAVRAVGKGFSVYSESSLGSIRFYTTTLDDTSTERMRITPSGNVGIGTVSPLEKVHVKNGDVLVEGGGLIMQSPDGTYYRISVENGGTLKITAVSLK